MYCSKCGKEIPENSQFCRFCGLSLQQSKTPSEIVNEKKGKKMRIVDTRPKVWILLIVTGFIILPMFGSIGGVLGIIFSLIGISGATVYVSEKVRNKVLGAILAVFTFGGLIYLWSLILTFWNSLKLEL